MQARNGSPVLAFDFARWVASMQFLEAHRVAFPQPRSSSEPSRFPLNAPQNARFPDIL
jgi:hypothetical protein